MLKTKGGVLLGPDKFENDCQERPAYKRSKVARAREDAWMANARRIVAAAKAKDKAK
jgi:hypothetical protein